MDETDPVWTRTTSIQVVDGSVLWSAYLNEIPVIVERDQAAINELRDSLRVVSTTEEIALMTPGRPTFRLHDDDQAVLAAYTLIHPGFVRSTQWKLDARLVDAWAPGRWLEARGQVPRE